MFYANVNEGPAKTEYIMAGTAYRSKMYVGKLRFRRWNEMHYRNCSTHTLRARTLGAHTHSGHTNSEHTHTLSFICRAHSLLQCNIHFTYYPARAFPASLAYSKALHLLPKGYNCARKKLYIISVSCIIRIIQKKKNPPRTSLPVWALHSFAIVALFIVFSHLNSLMRTA